jgi:hypothetical protein
MDKENLGPAERIINTLLTYNDHLVHNRPGMVVTDANSVVGLSWFPVTHKEEGDQKIVYRLDKVPGKRGKTRTNKVRVGVLRDDGRIFEGRHKVGEYRPAGLFPEVVAWMYARVADVWKLDKEFSARWASYAFGQEHRDLKVVLAAFMLVQDRKGDPVRDGDKIIFREEDFRAVGEAMFLLTRKDGKDFNPKLLIRVRQVLENQQVADLNRQLGFGQSPRHPFLGRWPDAVAKWLRYREENPRMLEGLVKAGFRTTVMDLASMVGFKPDTPKFYQILRWKQKQADDGRRAVAIGLDMGKAESWEGLTEKQVCQKIVAEKPNYKRIVSLLPGNIGLTRAIMAAAIEAGSLSAKDLIICTPTLEELGLLDVKEIKQRWEKAVKDAEDMRGANIATRVKSKETQEKLKEAADNALKTAVQEAIRGLRLYVFVDISGSMENAIEKAKQYLARFLQAFPLDQLHVVVFNTTGRIVEIKHPSAAGVEQAFRNFTAGGGTDHGSGVRALAKFKPKPDEDALFVFIGDQGQAGAFDHEVRNSGLNPMAFGMIEVRGQNQTIIRDTAVRLGIPFVPIDERVFADPYAIPRTLRNLVAATPVNTATVRTTPTPRATLIDLIIQTELLKKPAWA